MAENEERCPTKEQSFSQKRTAFLLGISLHYWPFVVLYGFSVYVEILLKTFYSNNLSFTHKKNDEYW
jgi:hypothetical protein